MKKAPFYYFTSLSNPDDEIRHFCCRATDGGRTSPLSGKGSERGSASDAGGGVYGHASRVALGGGSVGLLVIAQTPVPDRNVPTTMWTDFWWDLGAFAVSPGRSLLSPVIPF